MTATVLRMFRGGLGLSFLLASMASCGAQDAASSPASGAPLVDAAGLERWLDGFRKPRGGFGPPGARAGDPLWTRQVLRCRELLGLSCDDGLRASLAPLADGVDLSLAQRLASRATRRHAGLEPGPAEPRPLQLPPLTSWVGSPPLEDLERVLRWRVASGPVLTPQEKVLVTAYLGVWRAPDGGWAWPASLEEAFAAVREQRDLSGMPARGDRPSTLGAIAAALSSYALAGAEVPEREAALKRIRELRRPRGGYRSGARLDGSPDLWSTRDALRSLKLLSSETADREGLAAWLASHRHVSGAFAHRRDEPPSLEATWLVLESLAMLQAEAVMPEQPLRGALPAARDPGELRLFEALVQIGPDPEVAVALAADLGADLVLLKGHPDEAKRVARARETIRAQGLQLSVACAREEHLRAWGEAGVGYVTHCSDLLYPPEHELTERGQYDVYEDIAKSWIRDRIAGALVFSCSHGHRELLAPAYHRSLDAGSGYDALMVGWAFAPHGNVIARQPWMHRFVGRIALIGNHDAHGDPFHWWHRGLRSRTFFFARTSDYLHGFREAVQANRVVVMTGRGERRCLFGHPYWVQALERQEAAIRWPAAWKDGTWVPRPLALPVDAASQSLLPQLEAGRAIVVRAAAALGDDALPHEVSCTVAGRPLPLELARPDGARRPLLWAPVPSDLGSQVEVVLSGATGERRQKLRFGPPVVASAERSNRVPGWTEPPTRLDFEDVRELPFVDTAVAPGDFQGTVTVRERRADFVCRRPATSRCRLHVRLRGGADAGRLDFFVNGRPVGSRVAGDGATDLRFPVPASCLEDGAQRITLRTGLPGWLPSFPLQASDLRVDVVALDEEGEGR